MTQPATRGSRRLSYRRPVLEEAARPPQPPPGRPLTERAWRTARLVALLLLGGYLLFAHGCHADDDLEAILTALVR